MIALPKVRCRVFAEPQQTCGKRVLFGCNADREAAGMPTLKDKIAAEVQARQMLEDGNLPQPDEVEYGFACIRLLWNESKVALIVDLEHGVGEEVDDISNPYP